MVNVGGRPKGPDKKELTITLPLDVSKWLDSLVTERKIANKSFFIEQLLRDAMEKDDGER